MKCYVIYHIHIFEDGNEDYKIIGIFSSYDKALEVKEKYSSELPGFKDFPEGFCIEEFEVTGLDMAKQRTVYVIFTYIYKNTKKYKIKCHTWPPLVVSYVDTIGGGFLVKNGIYRNEFVFR